MNNLELIAAFERHGIDKADYFQFRKLVQTGGKVRRGDFAWRLMTSSYRHCLNEILGILTSQAASHETCWASAWPARIIWVASHQRNRL